MSNMRPESFYISQGVVNGQSYLGYKTKYVKDGGTEYFGYAPCGTLTSESIWTIKKVVSTSTTTDVTWANLGENNAIWDNYLTLTYS